VIRRIGEDEPPWEPFPLSPTRLEAFFLSKGPLWLLLPKGEDSPGGLCEPIVWPPFAARRSHHRFVIARMKTELHLDFAPAVRPRPGRTLGAEMGGLGAVFVAARAFSHQAGRAAKKPGDTALSHLALVPRLWLSAMPGRESVEARHEVPPILVHLPTRPRAPRNPTKAPVIPPWSPRGATGLTGERRPGPAGASTESWPPRYLPIARKARPRLGNAKARSWRSEAPPPRYLKPGRAPRPLRELLKGNGPYGWVLPAAWSPRRWFAL